MTQLSAAEYRRRFLEIARRRAKPGSGSSLEFLRSRTWSKPAVDIPPLKMPFVVVGAVATWLYMPQRATRDVDILIRASDAPAIAAELQQAGFVQTGRLSIGGTSWRAPNGAVLAVLESEAPWKDEALAKPNTAPDGLPVITLPYLVLLKLEAGRGQDLADIQRMLGQADEQTLQAVRDVVRMYRPADLEDLESLIALGKLEYTDNRLTRMSASAHGSGHASPEPCLPSRKPESRLATSNDLAGASSKRIQRTDSRRGYHKRGTRAFSLMTGRWRRGRQGACAGPAQGSRHAHDAGP